MRLTKKQGEALYEASRRLVEDCEAGFKELDMDGPDINSMGIIWFTAYQRAKLALANIESKEIGLESFSGDAVEDEICKLEQKLIDEND